MLREGPPTFLPPTLTGGACLGTTISTKKLGYGIGKGNPSEWASGTCFRTANTFRQSSMLAGSQRLSGWGEWKAKMTWQRAREYGTCRYLHFIAYCIDFEKQLRIVPPKDSSASHTVDDEHKDAVRDAGAKCISHPAKASRKFLDHGLLERVCKSRFKKN